MNLCIEIYKVLILIQFQIFQLRETNRIVRTRYKLNHSVIKANQVGYSEKVLRYYGPKIWNSLAFRVNTSKNLKTFKDIIKNRNSITCNCRVCQG